MVFDGLSKILRQSQAAGSPVSAGSPGTAIPHPEEPMNPSATIANTNAVSVVTRWLQDWGVPSRHWDHWKNAIDLQVYEVYPPSLGLPQETPAGAWEADGKRHLAIKPQWLNPGVIAHEQAHNSYALLAPQQKAAFAAAYSPLKNTDPMIRILYSKNSYGLTSDVEGHAEVYRYIGQQMPEQLKQYYPKLFDNAPDPGPAAENRETASGKKARIIAEPAAGTRAVLDQNTLPVAVSSGDINILCGSCGVVLFQGMVTDSLGGIVVKCPKCGQFNEV